MTKVKYLLIDIKVYVNEIFLKYVRNFIQFNINKKQQTNEKKKKELILNNLFVSIYKGNSKQFNSIQLPK